MAGGIEVGKDLVELGMPYTTRGPQKPFAAERARHNLTHISSEIWCEVSVSSRGRDAVHRSSRSKKDASIPVTDFDQGESGPARDYLAHFEFFVSVDTSTAMLNVVGVQNKGSGDKLRN